MSTEQICFSSGESIHWKAHHQLVLGEGDALGGRSEGLVGGGVISVVMELQHGEDGKEIVGMMDVYSLLPFLSDSNGKLASERDRVGINFEEVYDFARRYVYCGDLRIAASYRNRGLGSQIVGRAITNYLGMYGNHHRNGDAFIGMMRVPEAYAIIKKGSGYRASEESWDYFPKLHVTSLLVDYPQVDAVVFGDEEAPSARIFYNNRGNVLGYELIQLPWNRSVSNGLTVIAGSASQDEVEAIIEATFVNECHRGKIIKINSLERNTNQGPEAFDREQLQMVVTPMNFFA